MKRMKRVIPVVLLVLILLAVSVAVAHGPVDSVIILPINEPLTVRCQGADELMATIWGDGEWTLECRQYISGQPISPVGD